MKKSEWKHIARTQSTLSKKLLKKLKSSKDWNIELEKLLKLEEANSRRLANHLSRIAGFLSVEWDAEDFPIMEVFYAIGEGRK